MNLFSFQIIKVPKKMPGHFYGLPYKNNKLFVVMISHLNNITKQKARVFSKKLYSKWSMKKMPDIFDEKNYADNL
jgi:hypothetical protein